MMVWVAFGGAVITTSESRSETIDWLTVWVADPAAIESAVECKAMG